MLQYVCFLSDCNLKVQFLTLGMAHQLLFALLVNIWMTHITHLKEKKSYIYFLVSNGRVLTTVLQEDWHPVFVTLSLGSNSKTLASETPNG